MSWARAAWVLPGVLLLGLAGLLVAMTDNELFGLRLVQDEPALPLVLACFALLGLSGAWLLATFIATRDLR